MSRAMRKGAFPLAGAVAVLALAACASVGQAEPQAAAAATSPSAPPAPSTHVSLPASVRTSGPSFMTVPGYVPAGAMPDSMVLNPPPPAPASGAEARDVEASRAALALRGSARWQVAIRDADVFTPAATSALSCAAGIRISGATTPALERLMLRVARDMAGSTRPTKEHYQRQRPFMVNGEPTCTPDMEPVLRQDGSYPSGHSAIGYGWGLVMAQVVPERAAQLVARGRAFGDSRRVCNVHWLSDVEEGRVAATAVFARMQSEPAFQADVAAARAEIAALPAEARQPDCALENEAFAAR